MIATWHVDLNQLKTAIEVNLARKKLVTKETSATTAGGRGFQLELPTEVRQGDHQYRLCPPTDIPPAVPPKNPKMKRLVHWKTSYSRRTNRLPSAFH